MYCRLNVYVLHQFNKNKCIIVITVSSCLDYTQCTGIINGVAWLCLLVVHSAPDTNSNRSPWRQGFVHLVVYYLWIPLDSLHSWISYLPQSRESIDSPVGILQWSQMFKTHLRNRDNLEIKDIYFSSWVYFDIWRLTWEIKPPKN